MNFTLAITLHWWGLVILGGIALIRRRAASRALREAHGMWRDSQTPPPAISRPPITGITIHTSA